MGAWQRVVTDLRPLRASADFRRMFLGGAVAQLGAQMTAVTVAIQVYDLTGSSFSVGLVGLAGLVPLVAFGLYGGAVADAMDRRTLVLVAAAGLWFTSALLAAQALLGLESTGVLYGLVALQAACYAVNNPARQAIVPRLIDQELLPAAGALTMASFNLGFTLGPLLGAAAIELGGYATAYLVDVATFAAAFYGLYRLPPLPPGEGAPRAGLRSVLDGLRFLRGARNLRMTFVLDLCAMVLAQPRALFPALGLSVLAGSAATVGVLQSAPAFGALVAFALSGWISSVHRHGVAIALAVAAYGLAVAGAGLTTWLWAMVVLLALSGAADMVSSAYRTSVLQSAAPDHLRGRLAGVFIVVVAGGPRLGDFLAGSLASVAGERAALVVMGLACVVGVGLGCLRQRDFLRYDARRPRP